MEADLGLVERFFWDCDVSSLNWEMHANFIIRRLLQHGDLPALRWLRARLGDEGLREWIIAQDARGLNPRQVRYWALVLDIDKSLADRWVKEAANTIWERRR
jgi:hypothetical protein